MSVITSTMMTTATMHTAVIVQNADTVMTSSPSGVEETVVTPAVINEGKRKTPDEDSEGENVNK